jgi:hypothetical protein
MGGVLGQMNATLSPLPMPIFFQRAGQAVDPFIEFRIRVSLVAVDNGDLVIVHRSSAADEMNGGQYIEVDAVVGHETFPPG